MDIRMETPNGDFTLRAAALIVEDGRLLAVKRDDLDCVYTIGGAVKANETSADAAVREVREETGCQVNVERLAFVQERFYRTGGAGHHEVTFFYLMQAADARIKDGTPTDNPAEKLYWIPIGELHGSNLAPAFLQTALTNIPRETSHIISHE